MPDQVKSSLHRFFAIRVDQAASCRRQEAAGQQQIKINVFSPEHSPHILDLSYKTLRTLFLESFDSGRDDPSYDGSAAIQEPPNGWFIGREDLGIGVDVQG
jgi:hypothetical protein